jgi:inosine-uridine nucleoside N-ribohydrolase
MKNVVIITDIGIDPDDLVALILANNSPEININLIITSQDKNGKRVEMAKYACELMNYKTKIIRGEESKELQCYFDKETNHNLQSNYIESLDEVIEKNKHTYIVNIGALTEFANYLKHKESENSEIKKLQKKITLVQMGGSDKHKEYNFYQDYESAEYVFEKNIQSLLITKEITNNKAIINTDDSLFVQRIKSSTSQIHNLLAKNIQYYFFPFYFHDPLTLASIIKKRIIKFKSARIKFLPNGLQEFTYDKKSNLKISTSADYNLLNKLVEKRVLNSFFE